MIDIVQWRASIGTLPNKSCRCLFKLPSSQSFSNDVITTKLLLVNSSFIIIVLSALLLVCGDIETNPGPLTDKPLTLLAVYHHLRQVSAKWDDIGRELGVSLDFRNGLEQGGTHPEKKLEMILNNWILSQCSTVTWEALIKVLTENLQLATIAQQIKTELEAVHNQGDLCDEEVYESSDYTSEAEGVINAARYDNMKIAIDEIRKLQSHFNELLMIFSQELDETANDKVALFRTFLFNAVSPSRNALQSNLWRQLENKKTCGEILESLVRNGLIGYWNYEFLKQMEILSSNRDMLKQRIEEYETHYRHLIKETDFLTLMMLFQKHPHFKPPVHSFGLPTFLVKLQKNGKVKMKFWNTLMKQRFSWSDDVQLIDLCCTASADKLDPEVDGTILAKTASARPPESIVSTSLLADEHIFECFRRRTSNESEAIELIHGYNSETPLKDLFDTKEHNCKSLLQWAGIRGWSDVCEMLIYEHHCDPFYEDHSKLTVLHNVCRNGHIDLVRYFVSKPFEMDPLKKNINGTTPLDLSKRHGYTDITKYLATKSTNKSTQFMTDQQRYVKAVSSYLHKFDLLQYYPQKLSLQKALEIRTSTLNKSSTNDLKLLPFIILQKILAYDYNCRNTLLPVQQSDDESDSNSESDSDNNEPDEIDCASYKTDSIHPIDGIVALFLCADNFLRQDMMVRLSSCQMSIPFLLRDPLRQELTFPLWALRSIVKAWITVEPNGKHTSHEYQMVTQSTPIVTFMRLGKFKHKRSKSKILNDIISLWHHHHFFHRNMNGGELNRILSNGLVDLCWYLPGGKENDIFQKPVAFLNLHGSACNKFNQKQVEFLNKISTMTFMLVAGKKLDDLSCDIIKKFSSCTLLLTSGKMPTNVVHKKIISVKTAGNDDNIKRNIRTEIKETLFAESARSVSYKNIESLATVSRDMHITVDEDHEILKKASNYAEQTYKFVESKQSYKDTALPLQGKKLWHAWAKYDKEQYRQAYRGYEEVSKYSDAIVVKKRKIRKDQMLLLDSLSPLMIQFIQHLQGIQDKSSRNYFLYCLKLGLNNISRSSISTVHHEYRISRSALSHIQTKHSNTVESQEKKIKNNLNKLDQKLIDLSLGLEHLLREVGQVYETAIRHDSLAKRQQFVSLPTSVANLLIDGYPFEIMDGDAAHVPVDWVTAVLKEVERLLGNPRVFVLSVFGFRRTGKSTLLNTTFGLQFNVSSGRCTCGAFMQMLPIHAELRNVAKCDYVVMIDTEGLRAPELDSLNLKQLATFVIGLANETIINVFGEFVGDMDDILQTAVHAFIRMREINLKPSCQFVHQICGVVAIVLLKKKLNELTSFAANEEGCGHLFQLFSHVIQFDDQKDVHYFESLWMGDPPMAPVNPGYSKSAQSLKAHLIKQINQTECCNLSSFTDRMKNLWNALLRENFVFNFKNSIQINAYKALEAEYSNLECQLVNKVLDIGRGIENEIMAANSTSTGGLDKILQTKLHEIHGYLATEVNIEHTRLQVRLDEYFRKNEQSDVIVQWKANFVTKLEQQAAELKLKAINRLEQLCIGKKTLTDIDRKKEIYEKKFITEVDKIAENLKQKNTQLNEGQIQAVFARTWEKIIGSLEKTEKISKDLVKTDMEKELFRFVGSNNERLLMNALISQEISNGALEMIVKKAQHLARKTRTDSFAVTYVKMVGGYAGIHEGHVQEAQFVTNILLNKPKAYIAILRGFTYSSAYFTSLLNELKEAVDEQSEKLKEISFTKHYRVDLYLTACRYAVKEFERMIDDYNTNNDPVTHLERRFKTHLYSMFESKCLQVAANDKAARKIK